MQLEKLIRPNIRRLTPYSSARSEFKGAATVFLDANENPFDTGYNRYPDPLQWAVKEKISRLQGIPPERIFLGNGSDEVIDLLIRIFCEPRQDQIIILPPTYGMYRVSADIADVEVREVPLLADFQPHVEAVLEASGANSKLLFLCSPNNPTGNSLAPEAIRQLADGFPGITVVDEAYIDFAAQPGALPLLADHPRLVVMRTFSKAWGLAGIRLGMAFAHPEVIALLNKVKPPYNINQLTQEAALRALERAEAMEEKVAAILRERARLETALPQLPWIERVYPSDANFLLVKMADPQAVYRYLVAKGIIVRDRSRVLLCEGTLRITIGTPAENDQLLTALRAYVPQQTKQS